MFTHRLIYCLLRIVAMYILFYAKLLNRDKSLVAATKHNYTGRY